MFSSILYNKIYSRLHLRLFPKNLLFELTRRFHNRLFFYICRMWKHTVKIQRDSSRLKAVSSCAMSCWLLRHGEEWGWRWWESGAPALLKGLGSWNEENYQQRATSQNSMSSWLLSHLSSHIYGNCFWETSLPSFRILLIALFLASCSQHKWRRPERTGSEKRKGPSWLAKEPSLSQHSRRGDEERPLRVRDTEAEERHHSPCLGWVAVRG